MEDLPRQLADFTLLPGIIKVDYTDFVVEEIPLYPADGAGTHTYFLLEKAGLTTHQALRDVAQALGLRRQEIGFAGLKDSRAVTRQWFSAEHVDPQRVRTLDLPRLRVLQVTQHTNKIRLGHLKGNHFVIRVRQTQPDRLADLQDAISRLVRLGVPNYFGVQRFGYRGDTWRVGRSLILGQPQETLDLILGKPTDADHGAVRRARHLYDRGDFAAAARAWPHMFVTERRLLRALARHEGNVRRALPVLDKLARNFFVSAYQSHLFNQIVVKRLPAGLGVLIAGDLAWLHASGAVFHVPDPTVEQPRADRLDISPTGPLFGYRMTQPSGPAGQMEAELLEAEELTPEAFRSGSIRAKGGRRPLRLPLSQLGVRLGADERGAYLELEFQLPRGCYATVVLRELFQLTDGGGDDEAGTVADAEST